MTVIGLNKPTHLHMANSNKAAYEQCQRSEIYMYIKEYWSDVFLAIRNKSNIIPHILEDELDW